MIHSLFCKVFIVNKKFLKNIHTVIDSVFWQIYTLLVLVCTAVRK